MQVIKNLNQKIYKEINIPAFPDGRNIL